MDTPAMLDAPELLPTAVRGNVLDLEHIWRDADSEFSKFELPPAHLSLEWRDGLPYWVGLTDDERGAMGKVEAEIGRMLGLQEIRMRWLSDVIAGSPAFVPVGIPATIRPRYPRYGHSHTGKMAEDNHPPVRVRWPKVGWDGLRAFMVEALIAEGVMAWPITDPTTLARLAQEGGCVAYFGVASAPWFADDKTIIKHIGVSVAKLDFYMFE